MIQKTWKKELEKFQSYKTAFFEYDRYLELSEYLSGARSRVIRHLFVCGKTGSGKKLFAEMTHQASSLCDNPFIDAYINDHEDIDLFRQKFFGYIDAHKKFCPGLVEQAKGGTIYLHGFDYLPNELLKEIIQSTDHQSYRPVGSKDQKESDIRLILATDNENYKIHNDLINPFSENFLLNPPIKILPLAQRPKEIKGIVDYLLERISLDTDKKKLEAAEDCILSLENYSWPKNIPELIEEIETAVNNVQVDTVLGLIHLSEKVRFAPPKIQSEKDKVVTESRPEDNRRIKQEESKTYLYFYQKGDFWEVGKIGSPVLIKHIKGMACIHYLLSSPNKKLFMIDVFHLGQTPYDDKVKYEQDSDEKEDDKRSKIFETQAKDLSLEKLNEYIENYERDLKYLDLNECGDGQLTPEELLEEKEEKRNNLKKLLSFLKKKKADKNNKIKGRLTLDDIDPALENCRVNVYKLITRALSSIHEKIPEIEKFLNNKTIHVEDRYFYIYTEAAINQLHWILSAEDAKNFDKKLNL